MECEWLMEEPLLEGEYCSAKEYSTSTPQWKTPFGFKKLSVSTPAHGLHPTEMAVDGGSPVLDVSVASAFASNSVEENESI